MGSRRSPMQMFRRASVGEDFKIPVTYKLTSERLVSFEDVRQYIFPIVKPWGWVKRAKETLQLVSNGGGGSGMGVAGGGVGGGTSKNSLVAKPMNNMNLGTVYGLLLKNSDIVRYISSADLNNWQINEKDLTKISRENFLKKVAYLERSAPLFTETQTGIFYCNKLNGLTASLLAVPEVFNMLPIKTNNTYVVLLPNTDIIFITHCHDPRGLCVIGEVNLRYAHNRETPMPMTSKPIRIAKNGLSFYEASMVRNEASFPSTQDQLKTCKKSVFKRSRKMSCS